MATAQRQLRRQIFRSPRGLLLIMTSVIMALMVSLCGVGVWGLFTMQHEVVNVTQDNVPSLSALNDAHIALLNIQRDNRQAWFDVDAVSRARDIAAIRTDMAQVQTHIAIYLSYSNELDKPLSLANLSQGTTVWLAFEHILLVDLAAQTDHSNADANTLLNGTLAAQEQKLTDLLAQAQHTEQVEVDTIHANAYATSQSTLKLLFAVGLLTVLGTLFLGVGMTRHLTRVYAHIATVNRQLAVSVEEVQSHNEELSLQQLSLRQSNAALEVAIAERHQSETQLVGALDESERLGRHLQAIFASVQDALLVLDPQGHERYRNRACELLLGLEAGVSVDLHEPFCIVAALDGQPIPTESLPFTRVLSGALPEAPAPYLLLFPDGGRKVVHIEVSPIYAPDGTMTSVLGVMRDITTTYREERHKAVLQALAHHCALALTEADIAQTAAHILQSGLTVAYCSIVVRRLDRPAYAHSLSMDRDTVFAPSQHAFMRDLLDASPITADSALPALRVIATGEARLNAEMSIEGSSLETGQMAIFPLRNTVQTFGALVIGLVPNVQHEWDAPEQAFFNTVADEIAVALHRARLHAEVQSLAFHDPLTGLANHRALQQRLHSAMGEATRGTIPLSVIMIDVDHFRSFNETYGHDIGDQALQTVARAIEGAIRTQDVAARYGGEEFTVLLPETTGDDARLIAERIRVAIASARVPVPDGTGEVPITASLGVATYPAHASVVGSLLKAADIALYAAKHGGRDQVCSYSAQLLLTAGETGNPQAEVPTLPQVADLKAAQTLLMTIDLRDGFTAAHSEGVAYYAAAIATKLALAPEQVEAARIGGLIHDVGKAAIPDRILTLAGPLTAEATRIMREHPQLGVACLAQVPSLRHILPMVRSHHEYLDGSGYPDGLRGDAIDLLVRIVTVADIFEAYTSERPYHPSRSTAEGIAHLHAEVAAGRLDAQVVAALISVLSEQLVTAAPALAA